MLQHVVYITCQEPVEACRPDEHPEYGFLEAGITGLTRRCTELCVLTALSVNV